MFSKTLRVILSNAKNLAIVSGKVPARDPSAAMLCQDDIIAKVFFILDNLLYYLLYLEA